MLYAKEWGCTTHYGDADADARLRAGHSDWCAREEWFHNASAGCRFMVKVLGTRRIGHRRAIRHDRVCGLGEEERWFALSARVHFARVCLVVAPDTEDPAHRKPHVGVGNFDGNLGR